MFVLAYVLNTYGGVRRREVRTRGASACAVAGHFDGALCRGLAFFIAFSGNQLAVYAGTGFDGDGAMGDVAADFATIHEFDAFGRKDITDHLAGHADVLGADVAMNFTGWADDNPARFASLLFKVAVEPTVNAQAFVDMQRALNPRGVAHDGVEALHAVTVRRRFHL